MPRKPDNRQLNATSVDIMNAIRSEASPDYRRDVPVAEPTTQSIREIGQIIMDFQPRKNEFLDALVNRIASVRVTSKLFHNPLTKLKVGIMEFGETIEEIFVNIATPHKFDQAKSENELFKREIPDVKSVFHSLNYQQFYKQTVSNDMLRQAFISWDGITDLIGRIVDGMCSAANYDEFIVMKYLIQRAYLDDNIVVVEVPQMTKDTVADVITTVKAVNSGLQFMSNKYNQQKVLTFTEPENQVVMLDATATAMTDVNLLAGAFNLPYANLLEQRILVDAFNTNDEERLAQIFAGDDSFTPFTSDEKKKLNLIQMITFDKSWFMIFDNFQEFTEAYNGQGLYWNYFYHVWKTFSYSPFSNAVVFAAPDDAQIIETVTIKPKSVNCFKGDTVNFQ